MKNIHLKLILISLFFVPISLCADALPEMQLKTKTHTQRTALQWLASMGLRLAETGAGVHMLWNNTPHLVDFFYFAEEEIEIAPGLWGILFGRSDFVSGSKRVITRKRSMVPLALIQLIRRIPTRLVGGLLALDGFKGIWKEWHQLIDDSAEEVIVYESQNAKESQ